MRSVAVTCAAAVVVGAVSFGLSRSTVVAADDAKVTARPVAVGELTYQLKPFGTSPKPGGEIAFRIDVTNSSPKPEKVKTCVCLYMTPPGSPLSRSMPRPTEKWRQNVSVDLSPGESQTLTFQTRVKCPANTYADVRLDSGEADASGKAEARAKRSHARYIGALDTPRAPLPTPEKRVAKRAVTK